MDHFFETQKPTAQPVALPSAAELIAGCSLATWAGDMDSSPYPSMLFVDAQGPAEHRIRLSCLASVKATVEADVGKGETTALVAAGDASTASDASVSLDALLALIVTLDFSIQTVIARQLPYWVLTSAIQTRIEADDHPPPPVATQLFSRALVRVGEVDLWGLVPREAAPEAPLAYIPVEVIAVCLRDARWAHQEVANRLRSEVLCFALLDQCLAVACARQLWGAAAEPPRAAEAGLERPQGLADAMAAAAAVGWWSREGSAPVAIRLPASARAAFRKHGACSYCVRWDNVEVAETDDGATVVSVFCPGCRATMSKECLCKCGLPLFVDSLGVAAPRCRDCDQSAARPGARRGRRGGRDRKK